MNRLAREEQLRILQALVEGNSLRATSRMVDVSINTVTKLLVDAGTTCADYQDKTLRNLACKRVQVDEVWSFCYAKEANVPEEKRGKFCYGDIWTWTAICADSKLIPSWLVADRSAASAYRFLTDLAQRFLTASNLQATATIAI